MTASSAARTPDVGWIVTSYCRGAVFRQEAVRREARVAQRRHIGFAKDALAAMRVERVGSAGAVFDAGIDEFLLEPGEHADPARTPGLAKRGDRTAQKSRADSIPTARRPWS